MDPLLPPANPFEVPGAQWQPVSPRLASVRTLTLSLTFSIMAIVPAIFAIVLFHWIPLVVTVAVLGLGVWSLWVARRQVKAISYTVRGRDLWIRRGIMFRSLTVLPYVRIQYVDVSSGPLERKFGLASLVVYTASPSISATLPGLTPEAAQTLRDILTDKDNLEPRDADEHA